MASGPFLKSDQSGLWNRGRITNHWAPRPSDTPYLTWAAVTLPFAWRAAERFYTWRRNSVLNTEPVNVHWCLTCSNILHLWTFTGVIHTVPVKVYWCHTYSNILYTWTFTTQHIPSYVTISTNSDGLARVSAWPMASGPLTKCEIWRSPDEVWQSGPWKTEN